MTFRFFAHHSLPLFSSSCFFGSRIFFFSGTFLVGVRNTQQYTKKVRLSFLSPGGRGLVFSRLLRNFQFVCPLGNIKFDANTGFPFNFPLSVVTPYFPPFSRLVTFLTLTLFSLRYPLGDFSFSLGSLFRCPPFFVVLPLFFSYSGKVLWPNAIRVHLNQNFLNLSPIFCPQFYLVPFFFSPIRYCPCEFAFPRPVNLLLRGPVFMLKLLCS